MKLIGGVYAFFDQEFEIHSDHGISRKDYRIREILYSKLNMFGDELYVPRSNMDYMEQLKVFRFNKRKETKYGRN